MGPRFADNGSFEFEYGEKWKQLYEMKKQKLEALEREMKLEEDKLIAQMEFARYEHETETLKVQLQQREEMRDRNKNMWEQREQEMGKMLMTNRQKKMYQEVEKTEQKKKAVAKKLIEKKQKLDQGKQKRK